MHENEVSLRPVGRWALRTVAFLAMFAAGIGMATAQEVEPNEFVPLPAGTNLALGYYLYAHNEDFNIARTTTIKNSGLEVNIGIARYVHYTSLFGQPAGYEILEAFGSESGGHIGSTSLGSTFGASKPLLAAFFWPYSNPERKQHLIIVGYLQPPFGSYDKNSALNLAGAFDGNTIGWSGDFQVGWDHAIGDNFSYTAAFDVRAFGDTTAPGGLRNTKDPDFRFQAWANWNWTKSFQTSIGWESILGGTSYTNGFRNGGKSEFERLRAAASLFVAPNAQVLLEVNHDFVAVGGFKQTIGATARFVYVF